MIVVGVTGCRVIAVSVSCGSGIVVSVDEGLSSLPSGDGLAGGDTVFAFRVRPAVPAIGSWGVVGLALLTLSAATLVLRAQPAPPHA